MDSAPQRRRLTEKDWTSHEAVIRDLFLKDGLPLRKVKIFMEETHHFIATDRQWKHRIKRWKLDKNIKDHEMKAMVRKRQYRTMSAPHRPQLKFRVRKFEVDAKKIDRWIKEHPLAEEQGDSGARTPSDLSCYTESRPSSPLPTADVEMRDNREVDVEIIRSSLSPIFEPSVMTITETTPPIGRCRAETVDMTWAFDTPWQELSAGHEKDQEGGPLAALVAVLREEAIEQDWSVPVDTFALLLRETSLRAAQKLMHHEMEDVEVQEIEWMVEINRKVLGDSTLLVYANVIRCSMPAEQFSWLELRFRTASGNKFYREGHVVFRDRHGPPDSQELFDAIEAGDMTGVARILSNGEAAAFLKCPFNYDKDAIWVAAYNGQFKITQLLLEHSSATYSVNHKFENLVWTVWRGFVNRWRYASTPSMGCLSFDEDFASCKELTTLAVGYGARIDECIDPTEYYANILFLIGELEALQQKQGQQVLQYLLQLGVDLEYRNTSGQTPLLFLIGNYKFRSGGMISAFLAAGAEMLTEDLQEWNYLHYILRSVLHPWLERGIQQLMETAVLLLKADPRYKQRPITPIETPRFWELALSDKGWEIWSSVFGEMGWDMGEMNEAASQQRLQPNVNTLLSVPDEADYSDIEEEPSEIIERVGRWLEDQKHWDDRNFEDGVRI